MKSLFKSALFILLAALLAISGVLPAAAQTDSTQEVAAWSQLAALTATDGAASDGLGKVIAMSADGTIIAAGAQNKTVNGHTSQGAVYVFTKPSGAWANATSAVKLTSSGGAADDYFGSAVAISGDGSTIVVGAANKQAGGSAGPGAVYVFTRPAGAWASATESAILTASDGANGDRFGTSVGVSTDGSTIAVGAIDKAVGANSSQGEVYVFTKPSGAWGSAHETAQLKAADGAAFDSLGKSIAVSGDGKTIVSGTLWAGGGAGAVYLFVKPTSGSWVTGGTSQARLTGSDSTDSDFTGSSVAISTDGSTVVAGAPDKPLGSSYFYGEAYVFVKPGGAWASATQTAILTTTNLAQYDLLGSSVAVNANGSMVVVGAPRQDPDPNPGQPSAYMYTRPGSGWSNSTVSAALSLSGAATYNALGSAVATNGVLTACGAPASQVGSNTGQGAVYVFSGGLPASTITLTSSLNFSWLGSSVTFIAAVHPASGSGTPTGTVVFNVDGANKPPVTLASGSATYTTSALTVGQHTITATYNGDANFAGSVSDALAQRVMKFKILVPHITK